MENNVETQKKPIYKNWWFGVIFGLVFLLCVITVILNIKPKFEITDFKISSDTTNYTSIANSTTYRGNGILTTSNKKGVYIVALKQTLKSGGSENSEKETTKLIIVSNGKGEFSTYDYGDVGKIEKPSYEFEVIGSQKIN